MSVQNEIVTFEAKIQLDESSAARLTDGLKDATASCQSLNSAINATSKAMDKLRAEGKENTDEFKALKKQLDSNRSSLKDAQKAADQYAAALGTNNMSMKQLQQQAKQLRSALNSMHKEANPALWDKYQKELRDTNNRMKELKDGSKNTEKATGGLAKGMIGKLAKAAGVIGGVVAGVLAIGRAFVDAMNMTQKWGDKVGEVTAGVKAVWGHVVSQISGGNKIMLSQIKEVWAAAKEAQALRDGLFEKNNALKIEEAKAAKYIAEQEQIVNDSTKSAEERLRAQENILDKELELAEYRKNIASDSLDAALLDLSRLGLNKKQVEELVDGYLKNEDLFNDAKASMVEYNEKKEELEAKLAQAIKDGDYNLKAELNLQLKELWEEYKDAYYVDKLIKDYDLGNDALVEAYVAARVQMEQADAQFEQAKASRMRKTSSFVKQLHTEEKRSQDQEYADRLTSAEKAYTEESTALVNSLAAKEITEEEFRNRSLAAEISYLLERKAINEAYGKDVAEIEHQLANLRLKFQNEQSLGLQDLSGTSKDLSGAGLQKSSGGLAQPEISVDAAYDAEMAALDLLHEAKILSEEDYYKARNALALKYGKEACNAEKTVWEQGAKGVLTGINTMLDSMSQAVSAAKEAELATLDAQMEAELAAAGDNAEKREQIEAKYEAKRLDTEKKYADVEMGISIAQAIAQGALAVIQSWAQLGPVAGSIMAAVVAATTAAQIAVMVKQRNAIKNTTVSSSPSSSTSSYAASTSQNQSSPTGDSYERKLIGFSEGGYTGRGGRLEVAGVVHRGEYVVPQPMMRDPAVMAMVASIETRRRRASGGRLPGYASGGLADTEGTDIILKDILNAVEMINETPIPAYVVYSDIQKKEALYNRAKSRASLNG